MAQIIISSNVEADDLHRNWTSFCRQIHGSLWYEYVTKWSLAVNKIQIDAVN